MKALLLLMLVVAPLPAMSGGKSSGGYDLTRWGMPVAEVKRLYPGGVVTVDSAPKATWYRVVRPVGGQETAIVIFEFASGALKSVAISFPEQSGGVRSNTPSDIDYDLATSGDAGKILQSVRAGLISKYGQPVSEKVNSHPSDDAKAMLTEPLSVSMWLADAHTCIGLSTHLVSVGSPLSPDFRTSVFLFYSDCIARAQQGL